MYCWIMLHCAQRIKSLAAHGILRNALRRICNLPRILLCHFSGGGSFLTSLPQEDSSDLRYADTAEEEIDGGQPIASVSRSLKNLPKYSKGE